MLKEIHNFLEASKSKEDLEESLAYLIAEKGFSYQDIIGATYDVEVPIFFFKIKCKVTRRGIPIPALLSIFKFLKEQHDREEKASRKK